MKFSKALVTKLLAIIGNPLAFEFINRVEANSISPVDAVGTASAAVANTYVVTFNPPITSLAKFDRIHVDFASSNTDAVTINPDGLGAIGIKKQGTVALATADIDLTVIYLLTYDGTNFQITF